MNNSDHNVRRRSLAAPRPTLGFGGKVQCSLAAPIEPKTGVLKVQPDRPFATTYPSFSQLKQKTSKIFH